MSPAPAAPLIELPQRRLRVARQLSPGRWLVSVGFDCEAKAKEIFLDPCFAFDAARAAGAARLAVEASKAMQRGLSPLAALSAFETSLEPELAVLAGA